MFDLTKESYEIKDELLIRKILEKNTSYNWVFDKNDNKYEYDLKAWRYELYEDGTHDKIFKGFIEVEVGTGWVNEWPKNYYCVSFLMRKIFNFDRNINEFTNKKNDSDKTFYLKFNTSLNNCFCLLMSDIIQLGKPSNRNSKNNIYKNSFFEVDKNNVIWGIENCLTYINNILTSPRP